MAAIVALQRNPQAAAEITSRLGGLLGAKRNMVDKDNFNQLSDRASQAAHYANSKVTDGVRDAVNGQISADPNVNNLSNSVPQNLGDGRGFERMQSVYNGTNLTSPEGYEPAKLEKPAQEQYVDYLMSALKSHEGHVNGVRDFNMLDGWGKAFDNFYHSNSGLANAFGGLLAVHAVSNVIDVDNVNRKDLGRLTTVAENAIKRFPDKAAAIARSVLSGAGLTVAGRALVGAAAVAGTTAAAATAAGVAAFGAAAWATLDDNEREQVKQVYETEGAMAAIKEMSSLALRHWNSDDELSSQTAPNPQMPPLTQGPDHLQRSNWNATPSAVSESRMPSAGNDSDQLEQIMQALNDTSKRRVTDSRRSRLTTRDPSQFK
ncbi:MAG TPA: hypothetical protein EYP05_06485 [Piscirickettsiaceae bacterium]|nr:hypothetical protein [Piscirickettsiaceae bacterium]HIQ39986.1 hypothetical protein [Sulfurivirga caldicuralii]